MSGKDNRRKDKHRKILKKGEVQRKDGYYVYRWTGRNGVRHSVSAKTLEELRIKEETVLRDKSDGIREAEQGITVNHMFVEPDLGKLRIKTLRKSDVKRFYNMLAEQRGLKVNTIDNIHTVLHQVLEVAVEDGYLRTNPSDNVLKELKQAHNFDTGRKKALTLPQQELFLEYLQKNQQYRHWYPVFAVLTGTGMRIGECIGLRWEDIDLEEGIISVNHTLVYYNHATDGCYFNVNTPKTETGKRKIPMLDYVKEAFLEEKKRQQEFDIHCKVTIDGYTDFIFVNRFGATQHQGTLNKALRRIIRDCNEEQLAKAEKGPVLLPRFSCHSLRHTFTTRLIEQNVNIKVVQDVLGHKDVKTTLDVYADVTKELKQKEFDELNRKMAEKLENN